ncbi:MAG: hypothetical protein CMN31_05855 [Sandaracinus sp.]|nr:hypothetical protein [Sandaracinus sp.]MBJ70853.1 hypothetical protein [Sandaracinus sp.]
MPRRLGSYEVLSEVQSGGMATLYLGRRSGPAGFQRDVAIKVLKGHLVGQPGFVEMFLDEARIAARIAHPNVVHIEELGEQGGLYFLVMEYVHGAALSELLTKLARMERRLSPVAATAIIMAAAAGLHAAHETKGDDGAPLNVVHRDVSPQNILLGTKGEVKLIDFGIAKARDRLHVTAAGGGLKGKLRYMAPEQLQRSEVDRRSDIYALGVVLWEMLAMRRLFQGADDGQVVKRVLAGQLPPPGAFADVPFALDAVVMRALARDPGQRPATARELRQLLKEAVPEAAAVDDVELAALLWAVLGEELSERAERLPGGAGGMSTREIDVLPAQSLQKLTEPVDAVVHEPQTVVAMTPLAETRASQPAPAFTPAPLSSPTPSGADYSTPPPAPSTPPAASRSTPPPARSTPPPAAGRPSASAPEASAPGPSRASPAPSPPRFSAPSTPPPARAGLDARTIAIVVGGVLVGALLAAALIFALTGDGADDEPARIEVLRPPE